MATPRKTTAAAVREDAVIAEEQERDRARARRFFWVWLLLSTALTLSGNVGSAILDRFTPEQVAMAVRVVPPMVAAVGIASLAVLSRAGVVHRAKLGGVRAVRGAGPLYALSVVGVSVAIIAALILSYTGLCDLAIAGGIHQRWVWLWPVTVDIGVVISTVALAALRPVSAADLRAARAAAEAAVAAEAATMVPVPEPTPAQTSPQTPTPSQWAPQTSVESVSAEALAAAASTPTGAAESPSPARPTTLADIADIPDIDLPCPSPDDLARADRVVAGGSRMPATTIALVLASSAIDPRTGKAKVSQRTLAKTLGIARDTIPKLVTAAAALDDEDTAEDEPEPVNGRPFASV